MFIHEKDAGKFQCRQIPFLPDEDLGPIAAACHGRKCLGWRWRPLLADDNWLKAQVAAAKDLGIEPNAISGPNAKKVTAHLNANAARFGIPTEPSQGFCGYAGKPEAPHTEKVR